MRFMVILKATAESEAGIFPDEKVIAAMQAFNHEMGNAGVMLAAEGLYASSQGARITFSGQKRTVVDGPFTETKELIAGYWLIQAKSKAEAIELMSRAPIDGGTTIELRRVIADEDFAEAATQ
jgi:hypothetical protein